MQNSILSTRDASFAETILQILIEPIKNYKYSSTPNSSYIQLLVQRWKFWWNSYQQKNKKTKRTDPRNNPKQFLIYFEETNLFYFEKPIYNFK